MQDDEILNDLLSTPYNELSELEMDIRLFNEFEVGTLIGGGMYYFDSNIGDNIKQILASCTQHSFLEFIAWIERAGGINPELISDDRDTRGQGLVKLSEFENDELSDEGATLVEKAEKLYIDLVLKNNSELEAACLARRKSTENKDSL